MPNFVIEKTHFIYGSNRYLMGRYLYLFYMYCKPIQLLILPTELCGTPGYLAPEVLSVSMYEDAPGYGLAVDMWVYE